MKRLLALIFGIFSVVGFSQKSEEQNVKETIDAFFNAFHAQDSMALKKVVHSSIYLQRIGENSEGTLTLRTEDFSDLMKSIIGIPDSVSFQERIIDFTIQEDGRMAHAWTPYEFWYNGEFHHCGVNSFQLFKVENSWKIIYLIDTRKTEGCFLLNDE